MKIILICLSFGLVVNFISALDTFNTKSDQQVNNTSGIYHSASHLQGLAYQQSVHSHNRTITQHQDNSINNRVIHPKFRPWLQSRIDSENQLVSLKSTTDISNSNILSIFTDNTESNQARLADEVAIVNATKSSSLLQIFTVKPQTAGQILFADNFFQRQLRAFFGHQHEDSPSRNRSNIKTGL